MAEQSQPSFSPTDFVAVLNQTLEFAYPNVTIIGELSDFRISRGRWLYFSLKDDYSSVSFFGSVYQLPGPLEDGMMLSVVGQPRLHQRFGFSVNVLSMAPSGEGSIKKAADMLKHKLSAEGLFDPQRKRALPLYPDRIGLITATGSAAQADFIKILDERWGGVEVVLADSIMQGMSAPANIAKAIDYLNQHEALDLLVITRGGGSNEDLAAFSDERVVRAIAGSRSPTLVAIGHETDESLAELAADARASTPTNAAGLAVPLRDTELASLDAHRQTLSVSAINLCSMALSELRTQRSMLATSLDQLFNRHFDLLAAKRQSADNLNPLAVLKRGYALISKGGQLLRSVSLVGAGDKLNLRLHDGRIYADVDKVVKND
jgi:exodeoxyribonuclease VII large subunit